MELQKNIFPFTIVVILSFVCMVSCSTNSDTHEIKSLSKSVAASANIINVLSYGAKGDGSDDTEAFQNAWKDACSSPTRVIFKVPGKKIYVLNPIHFSGACTSSITMQVSGVIKAPEDQSAFGDDNEHWIRFEDLDNFKLVGKGTFDGSGNTWWQHSCKINKNFPCKKAPTALTFSKCNNLVVGNIRIRDAQQMHVSIEGCQNVQASNLKVRSPEESPNTDGIHVSNTHNITISNSIIGTGDDCISIESGTQHLYATGITCGPGHGISIGSLGDDNSEAQVSDIVVDGATLTRTTNGVRIKTCQGGSGIARNIKFMNVNMNDVENPIIIEQSYRDQVEQSKSEGSAVKVEDVLFQNIQGSSATGAAINFDCSESVPCQGITLSNVKLTEENNGESKAVCNNVNVKYDGDVFPRCS